MPINAIYSPRGTRKLWPLPPGTVTHARACRETFRPSIIKGWTPPALPVWKKSGTKTERKRHPTVQQLIDRARELRTSAQQLEENKSTPNAREQLGQYLLKLDSDAFEALKKSWQSKGGKGEVTKSTFRIKVKEVLPDMRTEEVDLMFEEWDTVHEDGVLDRNELHKGFLAVQNEAIAFNNRPDPAKALIAGLLQHATVADAAVAETAKADELEAEAARYGQELQLRTDVRLGLLLQKRLLTPSEFVLRFGKSGAPNDVLAAELSKTDFRHAVLELLAGHEKVKTKRGDGTHRGGLSHRSAESLSHAVPADRQVGNERSPTAEEIDAVFDQYDADHGGTMDMMEAKLMIKGLQVTGREADAVKRRMERAASAQRARASQISATAMSDKLHLASSVKEEFAPRALKSRRRSTAAALDLIERHGVQIVFMDDMEA